MQYLIVLLFVNTLPKYEKKRLGLARMYKGAVYAEILTLTHARCDAPAICNLKRFKLTAEEKCLQKVVVFLHSVAISSSTVFSSLFRMTSKQRTKSI